MWKVQYPDADGEIRQTKRDSYEAARMAQEDIIRRQNPSWTALTSVR
jgi:hypothetical protein